MGYTIAIDFGTTNSVIATEHGQTLAIPTLSTEIATGSFLIPSLVYIQNGVTGEALIGQAIREQGLDHKTNQRLFRNFKRSLTSDTVLESRLIDGASWTASQAGQVFVQQLLNAIPYPKTDIDQLVITVPVASFEEYTTWIQRALVDIPPEKIRIADESTAAALGYSVTIPSAIVLVIDFGGGTLDLSLVRLGKHEKTTSHSGMHIEKAQVIAKAGVAMGGSDIDQWIVQAIAEQEHFTQQDTRDPALQTACEKAKIALSTQTETELHYTSSTGRQILARLTRQDIQALMEQHGLFNALQHALDKVIGFAAQKGVYREDIHHVLLVGGTSLVPAIQQSIHEYFLSILDRKRKSITQMPTWPALSWSIENTTIRADKPFTAVVEGALQLASTPTLADELAHSYVLRHLNTAGQPQFEEIIAAGSTYPNEKPVVIFLGASQPNQTSVEILLGQVDNSSKEQGTQPTILLNKEPLQVQLSPPGNPGIARLQVELSMDTLRRLQVTVTDLKTGKQLLTNVSLLSVQLSTEPQSVSGREPVILTAKKSIVQKIRQNIANLFRRYVQGVESVDGLVADLRSKDASIRFDAAESLARRGGHESRLALEHILHTGLAHERASVARHLHHLSWFSAQPLLQQALTDADMRVQEAAIFALCRMRLPEAYHMALSALRDGHDAMRMSAVWGVQQHPNAAVVPILAEAMQAKKSDIRELALEVLGATETPHAIPFVKNAIRDPDPTIQYAATLSWVELAREDCFGDIAELITKTDGLSRHAIIRGFFHATNYMGIESGSASGTVDLINALNLALTDDSAATRLAAFSTLAWMRHPNAEKVLLHGFDTEVDKDTKSRMLASATHLMSPVTSILLDRALQSDDEAVRATALQLRESTQRKA